MVGENEQKHELYGVSPRVIAFVMIFFSLIVAIGILPMSVFLVCMIVEGGIDPIFLDDYLWFAFNPSLLVSLNICNIAYIWKMIHHCKGECTRDHVIWVGLLSISFPTIYAVLLIGFLSPSQSFIAISPIYLPFIFGIVLMYKKPVSELTSPWQEDLSNRSWWTMLKPTRWHRMSPPYEDGKAEEKLDLDTEVVET